MVELGAGAGCSAVCMLRHCTPARLTLTDGDATSLANLEQNLKLNHCAPAAVECRRLRWGDGSDAAELHALRAEVVVGADVAYARLLPVPSHSTVGHSTLSLSLDGKKWKGKKVEGIAN